MKRYISAILIPCLLLQLCSCYSLKEISLEELYNEEEEIIITTKDSLNFHLKRNLTSNEIFNNPDVYFSNDWVINPKPGNISLIYRKAYNKDGESNNLYIKNDTANISYSEISNITAKRIDEIETLVVVVLSVGLVALVVYAGVAIIDYFGSNFGYGFKSK